MKQRQIVFYFFIGLFSFILYQLILIFLPFMDAIFWAGILAFAFYPLSQQMEKIPRVRPTLAAFAATVLIVLIVVIPAAFVLTSLMEEAVQLYHKISQYLSTGSVEQLVAQLRQSASAEWTQELWQRWAPAQANATEFVLTNARKIGNLAAAQLAAFTKNVLFWVLNLILITLLTFFFLRDGKIIYEFVYRLVPMAKKNKDFVFKKIDETLAAVIRGQFVTAIIQALLTGFTFLLLGLPLPIFFGFLTFFTAMIPVTGAATVWAPMALYLLLAREYKSGVILALIGTFVISLSDNLLKPLLIGEKTKLPIFLLFLGILGGIRVYGLTGIFLGPIVLSLFFVLVKIYREEYHSED